MANKPNADITYLGRTFKTSLTKPLTAEQYHEIVNHINQRPTREEALTELKKVKNGGLQIPNITNYYFLSLMYDTRNGQDAWSVNEALGNKKIMEYFHAKSSINDKVFKPTLPIGEKIKIAFRLCGVRCCRKPSQFPLKAINELLETYTKEGDNYLDFSCGWGVRCLSALTHKVNYFGTDPNEKLVGKILEMTDDYRKVNGDDGTLTDIRPIGSEVYVPEWENKMDFIFTSPPYFALELYKSENQSYKEGMTYQEWLEQWMRPTVKNMYKYLKKEGTFAINIKDVYYAKRWFPLEKDTVELIKEEGFNLTDVRELKNITRPFGSVHWEKHTLGVNQNTNEKIFIFKR